MIKLNESEIGRLRKFAIDAPTIEALKKLFLESFIRPKESDVNLLAASRVAIDLLERAFKDLEALKEKNDRKSEESNIGM